MSEGRATGSRFLCEAGDGGGWVGEEGEKKVTDCGAEPLLRGLRGPPRDARPRWSGSAGGRAGLDVRRGAAEFNRAEEVWDYFLLASPFFFFFLRWCLGLVGFGCSVGLVGGLGFFFWCFPPHLVFKQVTKSVFLSRASCAREQICGRIPSADRGFPPRKSASLQPPSENVAC